MRWKFGFAAKVSDIFCLLNMILDLKSRTNWYVITGGPSSGKTTTVNLLSKRGYKTTIEHARHYLDTQRADGKTVKEARDNQTEFQLGVLNSRSNRKCHSHLTTLYFSIEPSPTLWRTIDFFIFPRTKSCATQCEPFRIRRYLFSTIFHW